MDRAREWFVETKLVNKVDTFLVVTPENAIRILPSLATLIDEVRAEERAENDAEINTLKLRCAMYRRTQAQAEEEWTDVTGIECIPLTEGEIDRMVARVIRQRSQQ